MNAINSARSILLCGAALGICRPAHAAPESADPQARSNSPEIVVTAQKRVERLEDVPMSVASLTPETIESRGIRNLQDLTQVVPGVQINFSGFATQPSIRGVSTLTTGSQFENNVAVYVDGYYQPDVSVINADFANLESIQVLKGPQGALYGRNATGGAFLITTMAPSETLTGKAQLSYGRYNYRSLSAYVSGPVTDRIRVGLAVYGRRDDGYYKALDANGRVIGDAAPTASYAIRLKVQAEVTDDLTATLGYNFTELSDARGLLFTVNDYRVLLPPPVGKTYQDYTEATNRKNVQRNMVHEGTLTLEYKTPIGKISSHTGYRYSPSYGRFDFDATWQDLSFSRTHAHQTTFQQGLDYNITSIKNLDLIVGAAYYRNILAFPYSESYSNDTLKTRANNGYYTRSYAAYVDANYKITNRLTLNVGGRYTSETSQSRAITVLFPSMQVASSIGRDRSHAKFSNFSPRGSLRYALDQDSNIYASISRGFHSGQTQTISTLGQVLVIPIKPETITAYEVGYKTAKPKVQFSMAAYYYDYTNLQVGITVPNPLSPLSPLNIVSNAPKAEIYGAEAQITWQPVKHLDVNLGAAWTHARYTKFANATGNGLNAALNRNATGQAQDWSGQQMARAPNFTANLGVDYEFQDIAGGNLMASVNAKYTTSYVPNNPSLFGPLGPPGLQNKQRYVQPAFGLVNTSLTWTDLTEHYKLGVYVNNLTDVRYHLSLNGQVFGDYGTFASPRTFGVRVGYSF